MKNLLSIFLVLLLLAPQSALALECKHEVSLLEEGQKAPCTGFLFSPDAEKKASQAVDDVKYYKDLSEMYQKRTDLANKELQVMDERLKLYMNTTTELAQEVNRKERQDFWQRTLYFGLGILVTSIAVYGASQLNK